MKTSELEGAELDYWVARGLYDFIREIHFTDGGQTLAIRGNDRGRAWDGRFLPSSSWEAASVVLERACRLEMSDHGRGEVVCTAVFGKAGEEVEGRGVSLRIALLRAFLLHAFGETVDDEYPHRSQMLLGNAQNRWVSRARLHRWMMLRRRMAGLATLDRRRGNKA